MGLVLLSYFTVINPYSEHFHDTILKRDCNSEVVHLWRIKDRFLAQVSAPLPVLKSAGCFRARKPSGRGTAVDSTHLSFYFCNSRKIASEGQVQEGGKALVSHKNHNMPFTPSCLPLLNESLMNSSLLDFSTFYKELLVEHRD